MQQRGPPLASQSCSLITWLCSQPPQAPGSPATILPAASNHAHSTWMRVFLSSKAQRTESRLTAPPLPLALEASTSPEEEVLPIMRHHFSGNPHSRLATGSLRSSL